MARRKQQDQSPPGPNTTTNAPAPGPAKPVSLSETLRRMTLVRGIASIKKSLLGRRRQKSQAAITQPPPNPTPKIDTASDKSTINDPLRQNGSNVDPRDGGVVTPQQKSQPAIAQPPPDPKPKVSGAAMAQPPPNPEPKVSGAAMAQPPPNPKPKVSGATIAQPPPKPVPRVSAATSYSTSSGHTWSSCRGYGFSGHGCGGSSGCASGGC